MKYQEIRKLTTEELTNKLAQEKDLLYKLSFTHNINAIENPMRIRHTRKLIAKISTALTEKKQTSSN